MEIDSAFTISMKGFYMAINIQKIASESAATLKGKMMGGVSRESAVDAITGAAYSCSRNCI